MQNILYHFGHELFNKNGFCCSYGNSSKRRRLSKPLPKNVLSAMFYFNWIVYARPVMYLPLLCQANHIMNNEKEIQFCPSVCKYFKSLLSRLSKQSKSLWHDNSCIHIFVRITNKKFQISFLGIWIQDYFCSKITNIE